MAISLPAPDSDWGYYRLKDGSIIYPSGEKRVSGQSGDYAYFVWLRTGWCKDSSGANISDGNILMDRNGIRYFATAKLALAAVNQEKRGS